MWSPQLGPVVSLLLLETAAVQSEPHNELGEGSEKVSLKGSSEVVEVGVGRWVESEYGEDV